MGTVKIVKMTNRDAGFYATLGPFLARRDIVAEIGAPVWDDDGKTWLIAKVGRNVAGFAALRLVGKHTALVSAFVLPKFRRRGIYRSLLVERLDHAGVGPVKAVASSSAVPALLAAGLKPTAKRGKFTVMERP